MPNHSEHATHLSTLSDPLDHSASDMDESVERGEGVNCTKDCVGSEEQEASGSTLQEAPLELYEQMVRTLYDYYFQKIGFLGLLEQWEKLLQLDPQPLTKTFILP